MLPVAPLCQAQTAGLVPDVIYRHSGGIVSGQIMEADDAFVRIEVALDADRTGIVSIPLADIDRATFTPNPDQQRFLESATYDDYPKVLVLWRKRRALLPIEGSDAGPIGLALARTMSRSPIRAEQEEALNLYQYLEEQAIHPEHISAAKRGRLQTLIALDRAEEAVDEAELLLTQTDDPALLIEAQFVLAETSRRKFEKLVKENPRWEEDLDVRPERNRLYHHVFDLYLFPFLFHGSEQQATARSLGRLLSFLETTGDISSARHIAQDILQLYPDQNSADAAREFLSKYPDTQPKPSEVHES